MLFLITPDIWQIEKIYGENDTQSIMSNRSFNIIFGAKDFNTATKLSQTLLAKTENIELLFCKKIMNLPRNSQNFFYYEMSDQRF